ncbi:MAG: hypothetical protein J6K52_06160 [Clostridia bacterium]|nr:hypothetical protein [Clostridia bacterium]
MNFFVLNTNLKTYTYPIIKIIVFTMIALIAIFRNRIFNITSDILNIFVSVFSVILCILCVYLIYISVAEIVHVYDVRTEEIEIQQIEDINIKEFSFDEIMDLVKKNDIIEIKVFSENQVIKIGSSSDYNYSKNVYFNKEYFINQSSYKSFEEFYSELIKYSTKGKIYVMSIDDIPQ